MQIGFEFGVAYTWNKETENAEVKKKIFATVSADGSKSLDILLSNFYTLYKFLSLAYYDAPPLLSLYFLNSKRTNELNKDYPFQVELLYHDNFYNENYKADKNPHDFLFNYNDIEDVFPTAIGKWFLLFDRIGPFVNLLNKLLMKRGLTVEVQFLTSIQTVETFHRNVFGGVMITEEEHQKRIDSILESMPPDHRHG